MRILLSLRHENIINIKDFLCENSVETLKDIYIVQVGQKSDNFINLIFCSLTESNGNRPSQAAKVTEVFQTTSATSCIKSYVV